MSKRIIACALLCVMVFSRAALTAEAAPGGELSTESDAALSTREPEPAAEDALLSDTGSENDGAAEAGDDGETEEHQGKSAVFPILMHDGSMEVVELDVSANRRLDDGTTVTDRLFAAAYDARGRMLYADTEVTLNGRTVFLVPKHLWSRASETRVFRLDPETLAPAGAVAAQSK